MKVRALGDAGMWVGFYNHIRRRGGDVFTLINPKDFSKKWMEEVNPAAPETAPEHFNRFGKGQPRVDKPDVDEEESSTSGEEVAGSPGQEVLI